MGCLTSVPGNLKGAFVERDVLRSHIGARAKAAPQFGVIDDLLQIHTVSYAGKWPRIRHYTKPGNVGAIFRHLLLRSLRRQHYRASFATTAITGTSPPHAGTRSDPLAPSYKIALWLGGHRASQARNFYLGTALRIDQMLYNNVWHRSLLLGSRPSSGGLQVSCTIIELSLPILDNRGPCANGSMEREARAWELSAGSYLV